MKSQLNELFTKMERKYHFDKKGAILLVIFEFLLALFAGSVFGYALTTSKWWQYVLAGGTVITGIVLMWFRLYREKYFSVEGLGELRATVELESTNKQVARKNVLDYYINEAVKALNENTCQYHGGGVLSRLCDQDVENGLRSMYAPFISQPSQLLGLETARYSSGAYLHSYAKVPEQHSSYEPQWKKGLLRLRDDLGLLSDLPDDVLDAELREVAFDLQTQIRKSYRNNRYYTVTIEDGGRIFTVVTAPIPTVCDDSPWGVYILVAEGRVDVPLDLENICKIFGSLFSNWLNKYNECVEDRCLNLQEQIHGSMVQTPVPEEVVRLQRHGGQG